MEKESEKEREKKASNKVDEKEKMSGGQVLVVEYTGILDNSFL